MQWPLLYVPLDIRPGRTVGGNSTCSSMECEDLSSSYDSFPSSVQDQVQWSGKAGSTGFIHANHQDRSIIFTLAALSVVILSIFLLRNRIQKALPRWLRPFAKEDIQVTKRKRWTFWTLILGLNALVGFLLSLLPLILLPGRIIALFEIVPWLVVMLMTALARPVTAPRILLLEYLLIGFVSLGMYSVHFLDDTLRGLDLFRTARLLSCLVGVVTIGNMPLRDPASDPSDIGNAKRQPTVLVRSPEDNLTLFQFWTMNWVYPLAKLCQKREIDVQDVWQLPFEYQHTQLYLAFREIKGKLIPRLLEANGLDLFISAALAIAEKVIEVSTIRLTSKLYNALDMDDPSRANFWCLVMLFLDGVRQVCKTTSGWYSRKAYERSRGETFIGLFGKLLTRAVPGSDVTEKGPAEESDSNDADRSSYRIMRFFANCCRRRKYHAVPGMQAQPASNAKVVNLVRGDTYEISQRFWDFSRFVSQPIKIGFTMYYLIDIMGWPSTIGFALMSIFLTINSLLVKKLIKLEWSRTSYSDKRAQAVAHFVEASRPLKLNGWTWSWKDRIMRFRADEMAKRLQMSYVTAGISTVNVLGGAAYPLASICLYTLVLKQGLPNGVIWPSLQLFGHLEASVKEAFDLISAFWKTTIPVQRVNKYMGEPDRDDDASRAGDVRDITFDQASFSWPSTDKLVLSNISLEFPPGLTVIRGKVGAGKSSLLLAALNEMELHQGNLIRPNEPVGYAQQLPWLQDKTIRDNIVFHQPFDSNRYNRTVYACALLQDFSIMDHGDLTKLEEGGVGLSGGQKARVALARTVYSQCRILLLDDPLAALDHDTARLITSRFLEGSLAEGRTIVMVTHRDDLVLKLAHQVIDMEDGKTKVLTRQEIQEELKKPYHAATTQRVSVEEELEEEPTEDEELIKDVDSVKEAPEAPSETGNIPISVYTKYMKAGGWHLWVLLSMFYAVSRYCDISRARLLEAWGMDTSPDDTTSGFWGLPHPQGNPKPWLFVLAGLSGGQIITHGIAQLLLAHICVNAAQGLFGKAINKVSKATFRYYDVTPTGQLKNRLVSDMGMVDGGILTPLESFIFNFIALSLSLVAITTHQPLLLIILGTVSMLFVYFFRLYVPVSRCLRRMEMRYLTPIIANIGVMQDGLVTIRALRAEGRFQDRHLEAVDDFQKQDHFFWSMAFWLDFRLSISSACTRAALILFMVWYGTPASAVGFVLTQTTIAMTAVQQLCEKFAQLQLDAVSLERVDQLNRIPEEETGSEEPPEDWPRSCDAITFQDVSFQYDEDLPTVLKNVDFEIPGGSTCAVLGRTGSGKSTIANVLLATALPSTGTVKIGSVDLSTVSRETLRNRVTIIQQDPTLFPGTLRDNIDPESRYSDTACLSAIHRILGPSWTLDSPIDAAGKNLSQGQRQLVSIGRAVLRRSGLVIMDEATASVDRGTAGGLQRVLREELGGCTVVMIAHRLEAVADADWCLRLEAGKVVECGPASNLDGGS